MPTYRLAIGLGLLLAPGWSVPLSAQIGADLPGPMPDSVIEWDHTFPLWGRRVIERGYDLPYPVGIGTNYLGQRFDVSIENLQVSLGDRPTVPLPIVEFRDAETTLHMATFMADLWVLPFLNVSVLYGTGQGQTGVSLAEPITYETRVDYRGSTYGLGLTGAFGFSGYFFTLSWNQNWFNSSILANSVYANVSGLRAGRNFPIGERSIAVWIGTMYQDFENNTVGQVTAADLGVGDLSDRLDGYEDSAWYQGLGLVEKRAVDELVAALESTDPADVRINYALDKRPARPRNLLLGSRFVYSDSWEARAEVGLIGRVQLMVGVAYRFPL